jgi:hypothetical protein
MICNIFVFSIFYVYIIYLFITYETRIQTLANNNNLRK